MRARGECGPSIAEGVQLGMGAVDALRWTPTVRLISPRAEKQRAPTLHTHAPAPPRSPLHAECLMSRVCVPV